MKTRMVYEWMLTILLLQYLGDEGPACQFKAAVLCSSPWNLEASSLHLDRTWLGKEVYSRIMGSSLKRLFEESVPPPSKRSLPPKQKLTQSIVTAMSKC